MRLKRQEKGVRIKLRSTDSLVRAGQGGAWTRLSKPRGTDSPVRAKQASAWTGLSKPRSTDSLVRAHGSAGAWKGLSKPRVPVQEPTGKFTLAAPPAKPTRRRATKPPRVRKLFAWLWRNAEPLAWGATLGTLAFSLWSSPRTQLTQLTVLGVPPEAQAAVEQAIRSRLRTPLALSDAPRQIERTLSALDWVQRASWRAAGVGTAQLHITPRTPDVLIQTPNGARIFADSTGFLFVPPNRNAKPQVGVIRLAQGYPMLKRGMYVNGEMRKALAILHAVHAHADVVNPRVHLSRTYGIRLWAEIRRGIEPPFTLQVRFGDASALTTQLRAMRRVLETPTAELRLWGYIDISTPGAEVVKPRHTPSGG